MPFPKFRSANYPNDFVEALERLVDDWDGGRNYLNLTSVQPNKGRPVLTTLLKAGMVLEQKNRDPDGRRRGPSRYYPTFEGYEYLERHRHRTQTWLRDNWFPLSIAVISSIIGIANVVLAVLNQTP